MHISMCSWIFMRLLFTLATTRIILKFQQPISKYCSIVTLKCQCIITDKGKNMNHIMNLGKQHSTKSNVVYEAMYSIIPLYKAYWKGKFTWMKNRVWNAYCWLPQGEKTNNACVQQITLQTWDSLELICANGYIRFGNWKPLKRSNLKLENCLKHKTFLIETFIVRKIWGIQSITNYANRN